MNTSEITRIDKKHVWHPFTPLQGVPVPPIVTHGKGLSLFTADGREIMDLVSSWWVNIHGHANQELADALYKQATTLEHVIFAGFTHEPAVDLTQKVLSLMPKSHQRVFYTDNGSTAIEVGLKGALQYWVNKGENKKKIVAIEGAYHGDTFGAMSVGGRNGFNDAFSSLLFDVDFIPFPSQKAEWEALRKLETYFETGEIAAFIYEPLVQGASGMRMYSEEWLEKALQLAKKYQVLCFADEVFTGFGRTGRPMASDYMQTKPDIVALSKAITGGMMPMGATSFDAEVVKAFEISDPSKMLMHGHSYTANPLTCAVAVKSFGMFMADACQEKVELITGLHQKFVKKIANHKQVAEARSRGTIMAIELKTDKETSYFNSIRDKIYQYFLSRNMLMRPLGNVFYLVPPYVIEAAQLEKVYKEIEAFLDTLE